MLESYMQTLGSTPLPTADDDGADAPLPSRAEDVDQFMADLAAAAAGGPPDGGERPAVASS